MYLYTQEHSGSQQHPASFLNRIILLSKVQNMGKKNKIGELARICQVFYHCKQTLKVTCCLATFIIWLKPAHHS